MITTYFSLFARKASQAFGSIPAIIVTIVVIVSWGIGGLFFGFTDTYQLIINTLSTLTTSIFVVLIHHTQLRGEDAVHRKLDEIIRVTAAADNRLIGLEKRPTGPGDV